MVLSGSASASASAAFVFTIGFFGTGVNKIFSEMVLSGSSASVIGSFFLETRFCIGDPTLF